MFAKNIKRLKVLSFLGIPSFLGSFTAELSKQHILRPGAKLNFGMVDSYSPSRPRLFLLGEGSKILHCWSLQQLGAPNKEGVNGCKVCRKFHPRAGLQKGNVWQAHPRLMHTKVRKVRMASTLHEIVEIRPAFGLRKGARLE